MDRIGPYQIVGEIGRGGMGAVLHGVDPAIGRPVAIKMILLQEFSDPKDREMLRARLFREAQAAGILNHPGIVTVYYVGEEGDNAFIAMEYVNGPTLEAVLNGSARPGKEVLRRVFQQTASALDYAHSKGIIHRDIKPANIMLDETGAVKICDFGIAKGLVGQSALTQTGTALGTPFFMSPEQIQGGAIDRRADQYSLGVVAYEAITGKRPFAAGEIQSLFFHIMTTPPPLAHTVDPSLSPAVSQVLQRVLAKDPASRYASCTEFVDTLFHAWDTGTAPEQPPEISTVRTVLAPPSPPSAGTHKSIWIGVLAAMVGLAAIAGGAFYLTRLRHVEVPIAQTIPPPAPKPVQTVPAKPVPVSQPAVTPPRLTPTTTVVTAPLVETFSFTPDEVAEGKVSMLKWSVKNAGEVSIAPDIGPVKAAGVRSVTSQSPITYTLTAKGADGTVKTASATLQVVSLPSIETFSVSAKSVTSGQSALLRWSVSHADRVSINQGIGNVQAHGIQGVYPTVAKTYVLEATGPGGTATRSVDIAVTYPGEQKIVRFLADPDTIDAGGTAVLRWEVVNASEVRIDPEVGRVDALGRFPVSPKTTTKYRISATSKGTFHKDVTVTVR